MLNSDNRPLTHYWLLTQREVKSLTLVLVGTLFLPFLVHLMPPVQGVPAGAYLLPMFYAPLISLRFYHYRTAILAGLLAPLLNHLATGNPAWQFVVILSLELSVASLFASALLHKVTLGWLKMAAGVVGYLGAKVCSSVLVYSFPALLPASDAWSFFIGSISTAWPGLLVLMLIGVALTRNKN